MIRSGVVGIVFILHFLINVATSSSPSVGWSLFNEVLGHYTYSHSLSLYSHYVNYTLSFNESDYAEDFEGCFSNAKPFRCYQNMNTYFRSQLITWTRPVWSRSSCVFSNQSLAELPSYLTFLLPPASAPASAEPPYLPRPALPPNVSQALRDRLGGDREGVRESHLERDVGCVAEAPHAHQARPDCHYTLQLLAYHIESDSHRAVVQISQHSCQHAFYSGGSSFTLFARNALETTTCLLLDSRAANATHHHYIASCLLAAQKDTQCLRATILLHYEHFDGVSGAIKAWTEQHPPLHSSLLDDHLLCSHHASAAQASYELRRSFVYDKEAPVAWADYLDVDKVSLPFRWYSGRWYNASAMPSHATRLSHRDRLKHYFPYLENIMDGPRHYELLKMSLDADIALFPAHYLTFPLLSLLPYQELSKDYIFYPLAIAKEEGQQKVAGDGKLSSYIRSGSVNKNMTLNKSLHLFMFGASHMRYNFDLLVQYYNQQEMLSFSENRKHANLGVGNMNYSFAGTAVEISREILRTCQEIVRTNVTAEIALSVLTGDWDLSISPLRRFFASWNTGKALLKVIRDVVHGQLPCGNVKHLLWMTSVPYPLCKYRSKKKCAEDQCYREADAVSAVSNYYLQHVLQIFDTAPAKTTQLSVLDTYSAISPRLIYRHDAEVACANHFSCVVYLGSRSSQPLSGTVVTPSGLAMMEMLVEALNDIL